MQQLYRISYRSTGHPCIQLLLKDESGIEADLPMPPALDRI